MRSAADIGDRDDLVDQLRSRIGGTKPAPSPWMPCMPGTAPREHGARPQAPPPRPSRRPSLLQQPADAGERSRPCPRPRRTLRFPCRSLARISWAVPSKWLRGFAGFSNWLGMNAPSVSSRISRRPIHRAGHALLRGRQHHFGAVRAQDVPPAGAHVLRHHQHAAVALQRRHHRQADAGVAAGGLDDGRSARSRPSCSAARIIHSAGRSFTLPPALSSSHLPHTVAPPSATTGWVWRSAR